MRGEFRTGFTGAVQDVIQTIKEYRIRYPNVGIVLKHMSEGEHIEALNENRIDIGLISAQVKNN